MDLGSWVRTERVVKQLRVGNKGNLTAESAAMTANNPDDQVATGRAASPIGGSGALAGLGGLATGSLVPGLVPSARSATAIVTPDPIRTRIQQGELTARGPRVRSAVGRQPRQALLGRSIHRCRQDSAGPQETPRRRRRRADQPAGHGFRSFAFHPDGGARGGRVGTRSTRSAPRRSPAGPPVYRS